MKLIMEIFPKNGISKIHTLWPSTNHEKLEDAIMFISLTKWHYKTMLSALYSQNIHIEPNDLGKCVYRLLP